MASTVLLFIAGLIAGTMNAAAGGGSFVSFPALVFTGVPSVAANMTSTVALFPGSFASAIAYRKDFRSFERASMKVLLPVSLAGGVVGALLLLFTSSKTFDVLVPWLLLMGTLAFAFGRQAGDWLRQRLAIGTKALIGAQFLLGVYGGYFGGAVGLMMMAVWSLFGVGDIHAMNAAKSLLVGATNTIAVVCFVIAGGVYWPQALVMLVAAVIGGYIGARVARRLDPKRLRLGISCLNVVITALFFWRTYAG